MSIKIRLHQIDKKRTFTIRELVEAIEKNGYKQAFASYWNRAYLDDGTIEIGSACAIGQAALNLGISADDADMAYYQIKLPGAYGNHSLTAEIIGMNDDEMLPVPEIGAKIRDLLADRLDETVTTTVAQSVEFVD